MNLNQKKIVIDLDDTICTTKNGDYNNSLQKIEVIKKLRKYKEIGFEIIIHTSRNMRSYKGNIGLINANTVPIIIKWLDKHEVPYDQIIFGKPWPCNGGFYVDDKSIRPDEFIKLSYQEIKNLINDNN